MKNEGYTRCPKCNRKSIIPIVYGHPSPKMIEKRKTGKLICVGSVVEENFPTWYCNSCFHSWGQFKETELFHNLVEKEKSLFVETEKDAAVAYAKAWNRLDYSYLENYLSEDIINESQYVLEPIFGKKNYIKFLKQKMEEIRNQGFNYRLFVQLAIIQDIEGERRNCVVITQGDNHYVVLFKIKLGKINRIDLCLVPDHDSAFKTEYYPGLGRSEN